MRVYRITFGSGAHHEPAEEIEAESAEEACEEMLPDLRAWLLEEGHTGAGWVEAVAVEDPEDSASVPLE